jgi:hypothetical protein
MLIDILIGAGVGALITLFLVGGVSFTKIKGKKRISKHASRMLRDKQIQTIQAAVLQVAQNTGNSNIEAINALRELEITEADIKKANLIQRANKDKTLSFSEKVAKKAEKSI